MKNWTRRHTLIAGVILILLTNAVALAGVYWNRSGELESLLTLTERELQLPYRWGTNRENSGIALRIGWRVLSADKDWGYPYARGNPEWLDQAKMLSLGFEAVPAADAGDGYRRNERQLGREVFVALELDGPAYRQALERARQRAAAEDAKLAALPDDRRTRDDAKRARDELKQEEQHNSRLFAVDAGLSVAQLRARYPERDRYAIVRAQVRPWSNEKSGLTGHIDEISVKQINVPHEYHALFEGNQRHAAPPGAAGTAFQASVAFGQRLEPWLVGARRTVR